MIAKIALTLMTLSGLLWVLTVYLGLRDLSFSSRALEVTGNVVDIAEKRGGGSSSNLYAPIIQYSGPIGQVEVQGSWVSFLTPFRIGDKVQLWIDPRQPERFRYADSISKWNGILTASYFALLTLMAGLVLHKLSSGSWSAHLTDAKSLDFRMTGVTIGIIAFALLLGAFAAALPALALKAAGEKAVGTVENGRDREWKLLKRGSEATGTLPAEIRFTTQSGQELIFHEHQMNANYLHAGDEVAVIYPRTFPHHARAANMSTLLFVPMVLSIAAIVAAGAGYVFWMVGGSL